ncbi:hypothetical protein SAMN04488544_0162 [Microlunatus sagamiharensis]|uniref:DUF5666 domain-containing protein n=1 Tax=Microlunatus sagamiharensis TaxID=546874 RepID=A0A1H2LH26_9ACTN|nr:DUF5666 domain-containing protein [Microlunatus sagamiharensis]SDU80327.1 hypothetical protein SAMN04488544_0162 [Microlunatus sagamiharensis]
MPTSPTSRTRPRPGRARRPVLLLALATAGLTLTLAGCSGPDASTPGSDPSAAAGQRTGGSRADGQRPPGVSGLVAAVSGKTLQVQSASEQTAVTWTGSTTFTETTKASPSALKTGLCAAVRTTGGGSASPAAPATPATGPLAAASVTLSPAVDGSCTGGFGGAYGGGRPSGAPSGAAPSGAPSGARTASGFAGRGTDGKVTSVDGSTFVVAAREPGGTATTDVTVTTSGSTTWTQVTTTSAKAATVGRCATATGRTSGTGALTATTVRLSAPASDGTCTQAFGGRRGGTGQPGQDAQPGQGATAHG